MDNVDLLEEVLARLNAIIKNTKSMDINIDYSNIPELKTKINDINENVLSIKSIVNRLKNS